MNPNHLEERSGALASFAAVTRRLGLVLVIVALFGFVAASCGDDDDTDTTDSSTTTAGAEEASTTTSGEDADADDGEGAMDDSSDSSESTGKKHTEMSPAELEVWQADLDAVGCWAGPVDGQLGPQTEAAIIAFQTAKGLTVDGLLGPQTEGALQEAVAAGETVCTSTTPDGDLSGGEGPEVSLTSASFDKSFTVATCTNPGESDLSLTGQADNMSIAVDATGGTGTLSVDGGTEGDGITLNGEVDSVSVGDDGSFTVTGTFGEPNNVGETFTLTGSCAGT